MSQWLNMFSFKAVTASYFGIVHTGALSTWISTDIWVQILAAYRSHIDFYVPVLSTWDMRSSTYSPSLSQTSVDPQQPVTSHRFIRATVFHFRFGCCREKQTKHIPDNSLLGIGKTSIFINTQSLTPFIFQLDFFPQSKVGSTV